MKYLIFLFIIITSFSVLGMKINSIEISEPGEFSYEDSVFYVGQKKSINITFYDSRLDQTSKPSLDSLSEFLTKNSKLEMQITVHTGSRGNDKYNLQYSERASKAIVDYLISKGIDSKRLTNLGAGETQKIYSDEYISQNGLTQEAKELLHQKNKRTILTIKSVD